MRTQITIYHTDKDALKRHPLWAEIMAAFMAEGPVCVESVDLVQDHNDDDETDEE